MAFADIIATGLDFGSELGRLTEALPSIDGSPATVPEIFLDAARHEMKKDLGAAWELDIEDATALALLDERADTVPTSIRSALAALQTAMFYESVAGSEEDLAYRLGRHYRAKYNALMLGAVGWGVVHGSVRVGSARIMI